MKKQLIILPIIILILVLVILFTNPNKNIKYKLPKLTQLTESEVTKIEFGELVITKNDSEDFWRLSPQKFPIDRAKSAQMVSSLVGLKLSDLISERQVYERYALTEEEKITLTAYSGDEAKLKIHIGKNSDIGNLTYIMIDGDPNVYSVKNDLNSPFSTTVENLRDRQVLSFDRTKIKEITFEKNGEKVLVEKEMVPLSDSDPSAGEKEVWKIKDQDKMVKEAPINDLLDSYYDLKCEDYLDPEDEMDFSTPFAKVTLKGDKEYTITLLERQENNMYPAISSENDYQFNLIGWKGDRAINELSDLIEEE